MDRTFLLLQGAPIYESHGGNQRQMSSLPVSSFLPYVQV